MSTHRVRISGYEFEFVGADDGRPRRWAELTSSGAWEPSVIAYLADNLVEGDSFVDVGAFLGPYTLLASELVGDGGRVIAVEPDPAVAKALRANVQLNGAANVSVCELAVDGAEGEAAFKATGDSMSHLSSDGSISVPTVRLDTLLSDLSVQPDLIKVDIEGGEACFFPDLPECFRSARAAVIEVHVTGMRRRGVSVPEFLSLFDSIEVIARKSEDNFHVVASAD